MSRNPGKIKKVVNVDLPRIRKRESPEFIKLVNEVVEELDVWD